MSRFTITNMRKWYATYERLAAKKDKKAQQVRLKVAKYLARLQQRIPAIINKTISETDAPPVDPGKYFRG